uniref:PID domain-containing protein n=1 Tax=Caenorhabditis tropicalis TaxID=1561998 RepID=A0A1I7TIV1_9PELO
MDSLDPPDSLNSPSGAPRFIRFDWWMAKDIYKTFKRSVSGIVGRDNINGESSSSPSTSAPQVKYRGGTGRTWIHPPDYLINGHVEYVARYLGCVETPKEKGSDTAREAIHAIRFQRDLKRSEQSRETAKLQKVEIKISIDSVSIADQKTKTIMFTFPLGRISFCADDKDDKRMFSFIARAEGSDGNHSCYAFTSEKLAEDITLTIGEAFDLAYKRYLDKNRSSLENQREFYILKKKIAELEAENQVLVERLNHELKANNRGDLTSYENTGIPPYPGKAPPALPLSPMPQGPPPNMPSSIYAMPRETDRSTPPTEIAPALPPISTSSNGTPSASPPSTSPSGPAPTVPPPRPPALAPPPPVAPRKNTIVSPKNSSAGQLEGLNLGEPRRAVSNVFDDSFDPRADEKKNGPVQSDYNPFGADFLPGLQNGKVSPPSASAAFLASEAISRLPRNDSVPKKTAADYDAMINEVDKKLAAMSSGSFEFGQLQTGDLGGIEGENEYGTPSDHLNPKVMNLKE